MTAIQAVRKPLRGSMSRLYCACSKVLEKLYMLLRLTKTLRARTAVVLAALYALCCVAPPVALAFTSGAVAAHCLTDDHHGMNLQHEHGSTHIHDHGGSPSKSSDQDKGKAGNCCGLFCVTAGAIPLAPALTEPNHATPMDVVLDSALDGRATDRIDRPPRSLLSL